MESRKLFFYLLVFVSNIFASILRLVNHARYVCILVNISNDILGFSIVIIHAYNNICNTFLSFQMNETVEASFSKLFYLKTYRDI